MAMNEAGGGGYSSEINVTPLVDVVLVLLIIFMVIVPLAQRGYDMEIPRVSVSTTPSEQVDKNVILEINEAGCPIVSPLDSAGLPPGCRVDINDEEILVIDLGGRVAEIFRGRRPADKVLILVAEDRLNYQGVMRIVDVAKSGVDGLRIGLVTEESSAR